MKLCKNCRHFAADKYLTFKGLCMHPDVILLHPVDGHAMGSDCFATRLTYGKCGIEAKLYDEMVAAAPDAEEVLDEHQL